MPLVQQGEHIVGMVCEKSKFDSSYRFLRSSFWLIMFFCPLCQLVDLSSGLFCVHVSDSFLDSAYVMMFWLAPHGISKNIIFAINMVQLMAKMSIPTNSCDQNVHHDLFSWPKHPRLLGHFELSLIKMSIHLACWTSLAGH